MLRRLLISFGLAALAMSAGAQRVVGGRTDHRLQRAFADLSKGLTSVGRLDFAPIERDLLDGQRGFLVGVAYDRRGPEGALPARIVLVALEPSRKVVEATKDRLPWQALAEGQAGIPHHLGRAQGLEWFAFGQPFEAVWIQDLLRARGGQNATSILIEGLTLGEEVASECVAMLARREDAVARIEHRILERAEGIDPAPLVRGLGGIPTDEATGALRRLFAEGGPMRLLAGEALVRPHPRPSAKAELLELLAESRWVEAIVPHIQEWGWFDALPTVRNLADRPASMSVWLACLPVRRALEDRPIDPALDVSYRRLSTADTDPAMDGGRVDYEVRVVLASADREAALFHGVRLATQPDSETTARTRAAGIAILKGLPRAFVEDAVGKFAASAKEDHDRRIWTDLLARVTGTG